MDDDGGLASGSSEEGARSGACNSESRRSTGRPNLPLSAALNPPVTPIRPAPMASPSFLCSNRCCACRSHAAPSLLRKPKNKIAAQIATFLRLGIVAWPPIADWDPKMQEISRKKEPFPLCGDGKESVIAKKLQKSRDFCFHTRRIVATRRILRTEITAQKAAIAQLKRCVLSNEQSTQVKSQSVNRSHAQATHQPARLAPQHSETPR